MPAGWTTKYTNDGNLFIKYIFDRSIFISSEKTGDHSFVDPRLALPFTRTPNAPTRSPKIFDEFSNLTEVLDDCDVVERNVIILGGSKGIGAYLTEALALRRARVIVLSRTPPSSRWFPFSCESQTNGCQWAPVDLADLNSICAFCEAGFLHV